MRYIFGLIALSKTWTYCIDNHSDTRLDDSGVSPVSSANTRSTYNMAAVIRVQVIVTLHCVTDIIWIMIRVNARQLFITDNRFAVVIFIFVIVGG